MVAEGRAGSGLNSKATGAALIQQVSLKGQGPAISRIQYLTQVTLLMFIGI